MAVRLVGQLIGLFSFDVGYEIDLARARGIAGAGETEEAPRRRAAPAHLAYATPPLRVPLGTPAVMVGAETVLATASARVHDFGAVSIMLQSPLDLELDALPALTSTLTGAGPLEDAARQLLEQLYERIRPAIVKPGLNRFVEDYYVLQVDRIEPPTTIPQLLARGQSRLAAALRCEASLLSDAETADVFRMQLSYYPDDLVVTEWNVALVVDDVDYADTVNVLEYLNVQLLELRYYDDVLDRYMAETFALATRRRTPGLPLLHRPYRRAVTELAAIRMDVAGIIERVHNALKLSGDLYLAKVYGRTAERLALRAWEESVGRKLDVLQQIHDLLHERVSTARGEALEVTIILLIALEIVLILVGRG
jgi:hypothetical protein